MRVALSRVSKAFGTGERRQTVLDEVSAEFAQGRFVALMGRSGSGKSTLLNLIGGLDAPTAGTILLGDFDLVAAGDDARTLFRRRQLGFVFQFFNLLPTLTVAENVRLPLSLLGADAADAARRAAGALAEVGMTAAVGRFPEELSGGEQQRVAIARALVHEPALVLADEPTGNLDLTTATAIVELLDGVCEARGATLIMATHSADVVGYADEVYDVGDGALKARVP